MGNEKALDPSPDVMEVWAGLTVSEIMEYFWFRLEKMLHGACSRTAIQDGKAFAPLVPFGLADCGKKSQLLAEPWTAKRTHSNS